LDIAAKITGAPIVQSEDPRGEIIAVLKSKYNLIKDGSEGL